ncbi:helix-turn-helix transcriptional regulator [Streptomyces mobaraensis NBRC 13819 = DSM 40847]|uniref:PadR family transcriptional regulator n=2 Tax=Streptomyces mobaraensis TaxID=35621 RepID=A0A5N5WBS7_STRMB|nr:PadR family transcriptional regulator [Streptomyces mobaraensis]EMF01630.1 PadR family transcriptional regulator [Streptomyces mobaraensis NBRC 13819 = DSM 40847]KAB7847783.1 PadR family transcriptional regulator [Streptomyces mobaraensis]QTT75010.1 helix-turn-helix transcriptional regulator [Streptomyces mobaraensis NBRC 13819 = DSM 40847]
MSAIRLLVLGAVRRHGRAHGYQVRASLEFWGAHEWSQAKPGSIYHALKAMAGQGLLTAHDAAPSEAGGPPRTEYELTETGEAEYFRLLRHALSDHDRKIDHLTAGVGFLVDLPRDEAIALLRRRVAALEAWRTEIHRHWPAPGQGHLAEVRGLWLHTVATGEEWARDLIERLEAGAYVMAGEGDPWAGVATSPE